MNHYLSEQICSRQYNNAYTDHEDTGSRITVPHKMQRTIHKIKMKQAVRSSQKERNYKGPVVIACSRKVFNHHKGQTYSKFSPQHLASGGWKNKASRGHFFTINSIGKVIVI